MRKKLLICIGVLCIVLLACLPLIFGPLEPLEDVVVMDFDPTTNCFEIRLPDGTVERYPLEERSRVKYSVLTTIYSSTFPSVSAEDFFAVFFDKPLRLKPEENTSCGIKLLFQISDGRSIPNMSVNDEHLILELPSGETYVSTDRRFTKEKLKELFY